MSRALQRSWGGALSHERGTPVTAVGGHLEVESVVTLVHVAGGEEERSGPVPQPLHFGFGV